MGGERFHFFNKSKWPRGPRKSGSPGNSALVTVPLFESWSVEWKRNRERSICAPTAENRPLRGRLLVSGLANLATVPTLVDAGSSALLPLLPFKPPLPT